MKGLGTVLISALENQAHLATSPVVMLHSDSVFELKCILAGAYVCSRYRAVNPEGKNPQVCSFSGLMIPGVPTSAGASVIFVCSKSLTAGMLRFECAGRIC